MSGEPTLRLIDNLQAGVEVEKSSRKLFDLNYFKVIRFFQRRGFSEEESRDLTQEVFFRVFNAIDTFRRESRFERWLFEIALNIYRNELRRRGAEKRDAIEVSLVSLDARRTPDFKSEDPLDLVIQREQYDALQAALMDLPEQMRQCCVLRYQRGMKYHEIAEVMSISIETTKAHLHQARKRLMEELKDTANRNEKEGRT